eukprot:6300003-Amphidinium_carterae.2
MERIEKLEKDSPPAPPAAATASKGSDVEDAKRRSWFALRVTGALHWRKVQWCLPGPGSSCGACQDSRLDQGGTQRCRKCLGVQCEHLVVPPAVSFASRWPQKRSGPKHSRRNLRIMPCADSADPAWLAKQEFAKIGTSIGDLARRLKEVEVDWYMVQLRLGVLSLTLLPRSLRQGKRRKDCLQR